VSRENNEKLLSLLVEKEERDKILYDAFGYQEAIHKSDKTYRIMISGNQIGKTTAVMREVLWWGLNRHPYLELPKKRKVILVVGVTMEEVDQALWQQKLEPWIPKKELKNVKKAGIYVSEVHFKNGNVIPNVY